MIVGQWIVLLSAILPAILLIAYVYHRDKYQHEPIGQIIKGVIYGVLSAFIVLMYHDVMALLGLSPVVHDGVPGAIEQAFFEAAVPEETAKLLMMWLLVRRNKYFDEYMDGIVYCVCVGMGFAGFENILYVFDAGSDWASVAVMRAVLAVPGHYMDAVAMGFFFSVAWFGRRVNIWKKLAVWFVPVLWHGIYDSFCMTEEFIPYAAIRGLLIIGMLVFFVWAQRRAYRYIDRHLERDRNRSWHKPLDELKF